MNRTARVAALVGWLAAASCAPEPEPLPNVILCVSDDQGWGDAGYQGHERLRTPHLDALARAGLRLDRFYATPMCTPTRAGLLTGLHPARFGILTTGLESLPPGTATIAEALSERGWTTGHFGKWHLGTLSREESASPSRRRAENYSPPWDHGFEVCFSTEASVPTWNPGVDPRTGGSAGSPYWEGPGRPVRDDLRGDDSRLIMDRVEAFIRASVGQERPFLAVVWFHTPHHPALASPEWARAYADAGERTADYWGSLSALDVQIGRLRALLEELGIREDTVLFFCSDNGPALNERRGLSEGSAGPFRGGKGRLFEGGVRVPAVLEWPRHGGGVVAAPTSFLDVVPTVLAVTGVERAEGLPPLDGVDLLGGGARTVAERPWPIAFRTRQEAAILDDRYKLVTAATGETIALYDLERDPFETRNVAAEHPRVVRALDAALTEWRVSCAKSRQR